MCGRAGGSRRKRSSTSGRHQRPFPRPYDAGPGRSGRRAHTGRPHRIHPAGGPPSRRSGKNRGSCHGGHPDGPTAGLPGAPTRRGPPGRLHDLVRPKCRTATSCVSWSRSRSGSTPATSAVRLRSDPAFRRFGVGSGPAMDRPPTPRSWSSALTPSRRQCLRSAVRGGRQPFSSRRTCEPWPAPGWLGVIARASAVGDGWFDEEAEVWDSTGRLVAQARQLGRYRLTPDVA